MEEKFRKDHLSYLTAEAKGRRISRRQFMEGALAAVLLGVVGLVLYPIQVLRRRFSKQSRAVVPESDTGAAK